MFPPFISSAGTSIATSSEKVKEEDSHTPDIKKDGEPDSPQVKNGLVFYFEY